LRRHKVWNHKTIEQLVVKLYLVVSDLLYLYYKYAIIKQKYSFSLLTFNNVSFTNGYTKSLCLEAIVYNRSVFFWCGGIIQMSSSY
jgi:hypothetical protein